MARETWKKIPNFSGYEASDLGRVRSWRPANQWAPKRKKPLIMRSRLDASGYPRLTLQSDDGKKEVVPIHALVARSFLKVPKRLMGGRTLVRHLNGDPLDSRLSNLQWGSVQENSDDKYDHGTAPVGENNASSLINEIDVIEIFALSGEMSQGKIASIYGISRQAVSDIHRGVTWGELTERYL